MTTALFHYHLFKNAGTSLDSILKENFGSRWTTAEFPPEGGDNTKLVSSWIAENPGMAVFSSHTAMGPLPDVPGLVIIPILFLRDPIARIISAYQFEAKQTVDNIGTQLARNNDLEGYIRARLDIRNDRQCRNFHTFRLSRFLPGPDPEIVRARRAIDLLVDKGVLGFVETFDESMQRIANKIHSAFPDFKWSSVHKNISKKEETGLSKEFELILKEVNSDDYALLDHAKVVASRCSVPASGGSGSE